MDFTVLAGSGPSFYLVPDNTNAQRVINDPNNAPYIRTRDGKLAIHVDFTGLGNNRITLGNRGCTITLPDNYGAGIQRLHCYFRCNSYTGAVILNDHSPNHSTVVYDDDMDFSVPMSQAMNSVVVTRRFNRNIAIGNRKYYKFRLVWDGDEPVRNFLTQHPTQFGPETFDPSKARYIQGQILGMGGFGLVRKAVNIHNGQAMAVKRFYNLEGKGHVMAIREINNMLKLSSNNAKIHDHILPIIDVEYDKIQYRWIEVFMPLREGSVYTLIEDATRIVTEVDIGNLVLYQMAKALKFMAKYKMVHRDIKPANILYETRFAEDGVTPYYHFQLADFNLSNESAQARTFAGTPIFMAPEVYDRLIQSCAADIWSLFATLLWIYNTDGFRSYQTDDNIELRNKITNISKQDLFMHIRDMAIQDPRRRVSARELVARLEGTSTSMPKSSTSMSKSSKSKSPGTDAENEMSYDYVPYISEDVARGFEKVFGQQHNRQSSSSMMTGTTMDGYSALGEMSFNDGGQTPTPGYYQQGRTATQTYGYTDRFPRNEEVELEAAEEFVEAKGGNAEGDEKSSDDGSHRDKGKGKETANPAYVFLGD